MATTLSIRTNGDCEHFMTPSANLVNTSQTGNVLLSIGKKNYTLPTAEGLGIYTNGAHGFSFPTDNPAGVAVTVLLENPSITTNATAIFVNEADKTAFEAINSGGVVAKLAHLRGLTNPFLIALQTVVVGSNTSRVATGCSATGYTGQVTATYYSATDNGNAWVEAVMKLPADYLGGLVFNALVPY